MDNFHSKERPSRGKNQRKYTDNRNEEANNKKEPQNDQNRNELMSNKDDRVVGARTGGRTSSPTQDPATLSAVIMPSFGRWDPGKRATAPEQQVVVIDEHKHKQQEEREKRKEKKMEDYQRSKTNGTETNQPSKSWSTEMEEEDRLQADSNNKSRNKNIKNRNNQLPGNSMSSVSQSIPEISRVDKPAEEWSEAEVQKWLESHGWKQYASIFGKHNIDGFVLSRLTMTQLETDLKISSLGHRIHIYHELLNLFGKNPKNRKAVQSVAQKNTNQQERQQSFPIELVQQEKQQPVSTEEKSDEKNESQSFQNSNKVDDSANKRIPTNRNNSKRGRQLYQRKSHNDFV